MSEAKKLKIKSKLFITGKIHALTGLHIGGNSGGLRIGGADSVVVRNALNNQPYVPGSSLRGKMRSLLERSRGPESESCLEEGGYSDSGQAGEKSDTLLGKLFGVSADKSKQPTQLIVRDAGLTEESIKKLQKASNTDMPLTEVKTEVNINRITSKANPREFERVPAGAVFDVEMILTLFESMDSELNGTKTKEKESDSTTDREGDFTEQDESKLNSQDEKLLNLIFESFDLIEGDSLGGHGSRGYGKVCFKEFKIRQKSVEDYKKNEVGKNFNEYEVPEQFKKKLEEEDKAKAG